MEDLKIAGYGKANVEILTKLLSMVMVKFFESAICKDFYGTGTAKIHGQLATGSLKYTGDTFIENHLTANSIEMTGKLVLKRCEFSYYFNMWRYEYSWQLQRRKY